MGRRAATIGRVGTVLVEIDETTYAYLKATADRDRMTISELIRLSVVEHLSRRGTVELPDDPWTPLPVHATYLKQRTNGEFIRATGRLTVTTGPLAGQTFANPTAASRAVVQALNPNRRSEHTNGWQFWRVSTSGAPLDSVRRDHPRRPDTTS